MHRWQFVKKSSAVQTPIFSRNPNHKNTAGTKNITEISNLSWLHLMTPPFKRISSEGVYSSRGATFHLSKGFHSKRKNLSVQASVVAMEELFKRQQASKPSLQAAKHILTALQRLPKCTQSSVTKVRKKSCMSKQQKRFGSPACTVHTPKYQT